MQPSDICHIALYGKDFASVSTATGNISITLRADVTYDAFFVSVATETFAQVKYRPRLCRCNGYCCDIDCCYATFLTVSFG